MNYYEARELQDENGKGTGVFHYTCKNDDRIWPVGYCTRYREPQEGDVGYEMWSEAAKAEYRANKDKYHGPEGHDSKVAACNCYRQYELDRLRFFSEADLNDKPKSLNMCQMPDCENYTASFADIPGSMRHWMLCTDHLNRDAVEQLWPEGNFSSFGSY